ncbi:MAG TPA: hypothetical protein VF163_11605 [Micromonosporaceae bacterium]
MSMRMLRLLPAVGLALLGSAVAATPAQAHSGSWGCSSYWAYSGSTEGAKMTCSYTPYGQNQRLILKCQPYGGGTLSTKYSAWVSNTTGTYVWCPSGYEVYSKQIQYSDGHYE